MGTRVYYRLGYIIEDYDMPGLYDRGRHRSIHRTKINQIRTGSTVGLWKLLCYIWDFKNYCSGCR